MGEPWAFSKNSMSYQSWGRLPDAGGQDGGQTQRFSGQSLSFIPHQAQGEFPIFFDPLRISHCEVLDAEDSFQTLEQTR
jgi:hypothetical protein